MKYLLQLVIKLNLIKALSDCILSYFGHLKTTFKAKKTHENSSLLKTKNTKEIIINHKGTRMVKDGED